MILVNSIRMYSYKYIYIFMMITVLFNFISKQTETLIDICFQYKIIQSSNIKYEKYIYMYIYIDQGVSIFFLRVLLIFF